MGGRSLFSAVTAADAPKPCPIGGRDDVPAAAWLCLLLLLWPKTSAAEDPVTVFEYVAAGSAGTLLSFSQSGCRDSRPPTAAVEVLRGASAPALTPEDAPAPANAAAGGLGTVAAVVTALSS